MKMKKMKTTVQTVTLSALLFLFAFAGPAAADTVGNTLSKDLCRGSDITYRLTSAQMAQWTGLAVNGAYSETKDGVTTAYYFAKSWNDDNAAICKKSVKTSSGTNCQQWGVYRNGRVLTKGNAASPCN